MFSEAKVNWGWLILQRRKGSKGNVNKQTAIGQLFTIIIFHYSQADRWGINYSCMGTTHIILSSFMYPSVCILVFQSVICKKTDTGLWPPLSRFESWQRETSANTVTLQQASPTGSKEAPRQQRTHCAVQLEYSQVWNSPICSVNFSGLNKYTSSSYCRCLKRRAWDWEWLSVRIYTD